MYNYLLEQVSVYKQSLKDQESGGKSSKESLPTCSDCDEYAKMADSNTRTVQWIRQMPYLCCNAVGTVFLNRVAATTTTLLHGLSAVASAINALANVVMCEHTPSCLK